MEEEGFAEEAEGYARVVDDQPSSSVRIHPAKYPGEPSGRPLAWCDEAYMLPRRPRFEHDPLFHAGAYYVQEASSTAIGELVKARTKGSEGPLKVLDLCAAPGGKSTQLASLLPKGSLLVSNEAIGKRVPILEEQLRKWGEPNVVLTAADPDRFAQKLPESFDLVLVDAPCSGEGLFRKMPEHRNEWGAGLVEHSAMRQKRIVHDAWRTLKEGGSLIYCTCTLNQKENEEVLAPLVKGGRGSSEAASGMQLGDWERTEKHGVIAYRSWPHRTGGEAFFFASLRKEQGDGEGRGPLDTPLSKKGASRRTPSSDIQKLLQEPERWHAEEDDEGQVRILDRSLFEAFRQLKARIPIRWTGTWVATRKGKDLIPAPDLALSSVLEANAYPIAPLEASEALTFIARDKLPPERSPEGWAAVSYEGVPLGWIKNLGDRVNGHFPKRWRLTDRSGEGAVDLREL